MKIKKGYCIIIFYTIVIINIKESEESDMYKIVDIKTWNRRDYFEHYLENIPCSYSITVELDITNIKKKNFKIYPALIFAITKSVNFYEEFRTSINEKNEVIIYDQMLPLYTVLNKESETFTSIWTDMSELYEEFYSKYKDDIARYSLSRKMLAKEDTPENVINISAIPWCKFTGFNLNLSKGDKYLLPIFTIGKSFISDNQVLVPLAIQVHHAVCDGFHVGKFVNTLEKIINDM